MGEFFSIIVLLVGIAFGILQIILFFKIWGMCNNVAEMKDRLVRAYPTEEEKKSIALYGKLHTPNTELKEENVVSSEDFKVGDGVIYEPMNRRMIIKTIDGNGLLRCVSYQPNGKEEYEGAYKPEQVKKL